MAREVVIAIAGLTNRFGATVVHDNLSLQVYRGEVLGVVGASGSGKSVLLRSIVGLQTPRAGTITLLGTDVTQASQAERAAVSTRTGVMFQDGALFSALTVRENVEAPMREALALDGAARRVSDGAARHLLDGATRHVLDGATRRALADLRIAMVGLPAAAGDLAPADLSGGMRKRAGLARALALDPEILFLDEPTAGLDPISASAFDTLLNSLRRALGLTVFLVTHDLDTLQATCDRIAVLADKHVLATGTLAELRAFDHPWVQAYFNGPRGHAAGTAAAPKTHAAGTAAALSSHAAGTAAAPNTHAAGTAGDTG